MVALIIEHETKSYWTPKVCELHSDSEVSFIHDDSKEKCREGYPGTNLAKTWQ